MPHTVGSSAGIFDLRLCGNGTHFDANEQPPAVPPKSKQRAAFANWLEVSPRMVGDEITEYCRKGSAS
ncbi:hypothetical protein GCM10010174_47420 [Kutzneria viridogrisea]|uniref:Uncharacterized protein n=2 Tax=Kutzneria TaxID=43356 RepID=W5WDL8_9PSEU|nr:hypothetical protein [Kutzneria albida]AHH98865.1 hypothetical protein KALB_5503 [Kutzneria albida DSM 43870]MBA8923581.1 hypothetical protein [Kutzneria viridogrisea]